MNVIPLALDNPWRVYMALKSINQDLVTYDFNKNIFFLFVFFLTIMNEIQNNSSLFMKMKYLIPIHCIILW